MTIHEGAAKAYVYNFGDGTFPVIDTVRETVVATIDVLFSNGIESGYTTEWSGVTP